MRGPLGKGLHYEDQARAYLAARGLRPLQSNYRCRFGEIDLVMGDAQTLCFIEVKYRKSDAFGGAAAAIPVSKQRKLIRSAECYLAANPALANCPLRFDAVLIQGQPDGVERIDWIRNAFASDR